MLVSWLRKNQFISTVLGNVDECCLGWCFAHPELGSFHASCDGVSIFFHNSKQLLKENRVRVATSDGLEQLIILGNGAIRISAREFEAEIRAAEQEIRALIGG